MTLAVVLCAISFYWAAVALPGHFAGQQQPADQQATPAQPDSSPQTTPAQTQPSSETQPSSKTPAPAPAPKPAAKKRTTRRKKPASSNCPPANSAASTPSPASGENPTADASTNAAPSTANAPGNCPPPKVVVRQGGTKEPSIELAGGTGQQANNQRSTTDQLLKSTGENLKKIEGRKLTASQQDMVSQIQQYVKESKAAVAAGDTERGRNLAVKAQMLSDELAKP